MRIFLALFPSPAAQEAAFRVIARLRRPNDDVSWVKRENLHYTLRFMGELDEDGVSRVIAAGRLGVAERPPFAATLGEVGAFPSAHRARVLWLGLSQGADALVSLARALEQALRDHGFEAAERPFSPHLTLGRVRRREGDWSTRLAGVAAELESGWAPAFTVDRVAIVESTLSPGGSIYRVRAQAALAA